MSTQAQRMGSQTVWDQPQYTFKQPLQLEELLEATPGAKRYPQQRQFSPPSLNVSITPSRPGPFPPAVPFGTGFVRQPQMRSSSFNPLDVDVNFALDTSPSSFGGSPHSAHLPSIYNQPSLNALDPNQSNYQFGPNLEVIHTPEASPNPNSAMTNQQLSQSYLPTGPMQFATPLPLPSRQSELQSHYFNVPYMRPQQDSFQSAKRAKPSDDYEDTQGDQLDAQEQEAARPKP